ncbi:membrane protein [Evansella vedderi]|uniref:Membrane protein n=1 Tax=Evansella vedderi TaxID=38282 RepID=A0ABT9ZQ95_9BACI|nr:YihY/virulence factor BrkB family protein [Evansella vedderi]MDQ0253409.1 membrane protein [Evansella vedderi]
MEFIISIFVRFKEHRLIELAAQCAYYLLLSIFPFLIFIISLFSFLPIALEFDLELLRDVVPAEIFYFIEGQWTRITAQHNTGLLSFSILFTIWTASLALNTILHLLNRAYHVTEERKFFKGRIISIFLTIGMFAVVLVALSLQVVGGVMKDFFAIDLNFLNFNLFRWVISFVILFIVFTLLYLIGPNTKLKLREVYIGALFATLGWQLTSLLFSFYLDNFANYTATYGTIGAVIALMIWFHLSSVIILLGGEINAELKESS